MDYVRTGIEGLDEIVGGGIPRGSTVLITGESGTGKTILAVQFIVNGILKYGEPGLIVTCEEVPEKLRARMLAFGWDLKKLEENGKLITIDLASVRIGVPAETKFPEYQPRSLDPQNLLVSIYNAVKERGIKRVAIDSIPALGLRVGSVEELRNIIFMMCALLSKMGCTTFLVTETTDARRTSRYGVEEFVSDGIIVLSLVKDEKSGRWIRKLWVKKMRGTRHSLDECVFEILDDGIHVMRSL
ncbi:MAG: ATPase domain-containing protein [Candidatus Baldrarchaeia archaeon]